MNNKKTMLFLSLLSVSFLASASTSNTTYKPNKVTNLIGWSLSVPVDNDGNGKADNIKEEELASGYSNPPYFYINTDGDLVFKSYVKGFKTSKNTTYTRSELREMLRKGKTSINTKGVDKNNWVLSSSPKAEQEKAGGVDGTLTATLSVNHVTETGKDYQIGRVIIGQIHANDDEPLRLYYRKLPMNDNASIYFAHEPRHGFGKEKYYSLIGSKSNTQSNPKNGIAINEKFSYSIVAKGNTIKVTISRPNMADVSKTIDISKSGYDKEGQYLYFKAGVYNQNKTGKPSEYAQATFYSIKATHNK
ncbi:polysaccharide lyase family 7 protein [Marinomonas sp. TI.3.20]|uniref:polysaccharide lyase family 7 protein n=1 Tax=Marinomonas sp. TI.3.20 TaxID=3121296 RepID=UPI00311FBFB8